MATTPTRTAAPVVPFMNGSPTTFIPTSHIAPSYPGNIVGGLTSGNESFFSKLKRIIVSIFFYLFNKSLPRRLLAPLPLPLLLLEVPLKATITIRLD